MRNSIKYLIANNYGKLWQMTNEVNVFEVLFYFVYHFKNFKRWLKDPNASCLEKKLLMCIKST